MLEIKNLELEHIRKFLFELKLKASLSRHRTKFIKLLDERIKDYQDSGFELLKEFAKKDESGNPIIENNTVGFDNLNDRINYQKEEAVLLNEIVKINLDEYPNIYNSLKQVLSEIDIELNKEDANSYDVLCELFNVE